MGEQAWGIKWDLAQLPGSEAIEERKEDKEDEEDEESKEVLPSTSDEKPKIAKFKPEDIDRFLMNKQAQDTLKFNGYDNLPSFYLKKDISSIDEVISVVQSDLNETYKKLENTATFALDQNNIMLAKAKNKNPRKETLNNLNTYNVLSTYYSNLNNLKNYKEKSGSGMTYFNNPYQLLDRLELLGGSILAGNNGVIPEFSQIAHLLNQMKVISKKQLNELIKNYIVNK